MANGLRVERLHSSALVPSARRARREIRTHGLVWHSDGGPTMHYTERIPYNVPKSYSVVERFVLNSEETGM